jgi:tetratricopeptide (TPR) repeat protein
MEKRIVTAVRGAVALVVVAAAVAAFYAFCVMPYRCNLVKSAQTAAIERFFENGAAPAARMAARRSLAELQPCTFPPCRDVGSDMLIGATCRLLGRNDEAIRAYRHALTLDRRPEIFTNLAAAELAAGDRNAAREDFMRAALFNPWMIRNIEDGLMRQEIRDRLIALWPEDADYIRLADTIVLE